MVDFKEYNKEIVVSIKGGIIELRIELLEEDVIDIGEVEIFVEIKVKIIEVLMFVIKLDKKGLERILFVGVENDIIVVFFVILGVVIIGD